MEISKINYKPVNNWGLIFFLFQAILGVFCVATIFGLSPLDSSLEMKLISGATLYFLID